MRTITLLSLLAVILSTASLHAAPPASGKPAPVEDGWLSKAVLADLEAAAASGQYEALRTRTRQAVVERLACGQFDNLTALNDMIYVLRASEHLPLAAGTEGGKPLAAWLVNNRDVSRRLFRAMDSARFANEAMAHFAELWKEAEKDVLAYPDLAVAFATAQPRGHQRKGENAATMLESFRWYTSPKLAFRYDLKKMPYELAQYLADTRLSIQERQWAYAKYARSRAPGRAYFDVKYDIDHLKEGAPKKIANLPYTLENLHRVGGVCIDQAYYAAEVCKAIGMPATIVTGKGGSGVGHAWLAYLQMNRGEALWDTSTGRYASQKYFTGTCRNAATGKTMLDSELTLAGAAALLDLPRREQADAAAHLADLAGRLEADWKDRAPDFKALGNLADLYDRSAGAKKASREWFSAEQAIDATLRRELLHRAIALNLASGEAWRQVVALRKAGQLPLEELDAFFDVLVAKTSRQWPEYSCRMVLEIVPTIEDAGKRQSVYRKAYGTYRKRPDLAGQILIALGDDYKAQDKQKEALAAYEQAAMQAADLAEVVTLAAGKAESLLVSAGRRDLAIQMYLKLYRRARPEKIAPQFAGQTAHYKLGKRLAELLTLEGKTAQAEQILKEIGATKGKF